MIEDLLIGRHWLVIDDHLPEFVVFNLLLMFHSLKMFIAHVVYRSYILIRHLILQLLLYLQTLAVLEKHQTEDLQELMCKLNGLGNSFNLLQVKVGYLADWGPLGGKLCCLD